MKDRLPSSIIEIAHRVSKIPFAKSLIKPFYYPYKKLIEAMRVRNFKKDALMVLNAFDECMMENSIQYTVIFGTLLGAIREHGFIKHDCDIDVAVSIEDHTEYLRGILKTAGFKLIHRFQIDDGSLGCEETYVFEGTTVSIDIFYICPPIDTLPYCCCWNLYGDCTTPRESMKKYGGVIPRRIELPFSYNTMRVPFESIQINIDINAREISEYTYGPDYMTPNPCYTIPTSHRVIWKEQNAFYEEFE